MSPRLLTVPIAETVSKVSTCDPRTEFAGRLFEYIDIGLVNRETKRIEGSNRIAGEVAPSRARQIVKARDVLVSTVRPNLNAVAQIPDDLEEAIASTGFTVLRPKESIIDARYLFQWVKSPQFVTRMVERATGANYPAVSDRLVKDSMIPLPPLAEQSRIAAILDKADALREKRQQAINKLDSLQQSVFLGIFGDPVTNPKRWAILPLGQLCDVRDGTHDSPLYVKDGYPLITSKNLSKGYIDLSDVNFISEADFEQVNKRSKVDEGDILMPMIGTVGNPVLVDHTPNFAIKNVALIKFLKDSPSNIYLRQLLSGHYFDYVTSKNNRGGTQKFISLGDIRSLPIVLPPPELQKSFDKVELKVRNTRRRQLESLGVVENLFHSLQQRAFKGGMFQETM